MRPILILALVAMAAPAAALPPMHEDRTIRGGFYALFYADTLRRNCPEIGARMVRAYGRLKALERYARDAGYSEADYEAMEDDDSVKDALRREIRADLAARGAAGDASGYCAVGRDEIAAGSEIGKLLRVK